MNELNTNPYIPLEDLCKESLKSALLLTGIKESDTLTMSAVNNILSTYMGILKDVCNCFLRPLPDVTAWDIFSQYIKSREDRH